MCRKAQRTEDFQQNGWTVIRFWNDDVLHQIDDACLHILRSIPKEPS
ncbi:MULTISPECIES: DUF559 domain-containing protein [unclassified Rhizobium]